MGRPVGTQAQGEGEGSRFAVHGARFAERERERMGEGGNEGKRERGERGTQAQGREGGEGELGATEI